MKRFVVIIFFIVSVVFGFNVCAKASDTIVNNYARVTSLNNFNSIDPDTLQLDSLLDKSSKQLFFDGDTVLIHQTKGAIFGYPSTDIKKAGTLIDVGATGSFEIHIVKKVDVLNKYLILQGNLHLHPDFINIGGYKAFNANHILQVVKVFTYRKKRIINKTITSIPWDSISKKGGIVAIIGDSIKLGGNIDVSGKGFLGADPGNIISTAHCSKEDSVKLKAFSFLRNAFDSSGLKGESFIVFDSLPRGRKPARTGGGGGNGYFAGGGGGGNYNSNSGSDNSGGDGGDEGASCGMSTTTNTGGLAGLSNYIVYNNSNNVAALFGGGGGCSIQSATLKATKGGNGGGIILIMANYLDGNGFSINANGSSVLDSASSGAGGGGAGGTILLDINKYKNSIVSAQGGNGGSTIKNLLDGSHGGGGGGGLIWYNGVKPDSVNVIRGVRGNPPWWDSRNAQNGRSGGTITSLRLPLYNFLYNIMPANQEVCEADVPMQIKATDPKGGVNYEYLWQKSVNLSIWDSVGNAKLFQPPSLMVTTYYRRIVRALTNDNNLITTDTSYAVKINVLPKIVNNTIVKDTIEICKGLKFPYVHANNLLSGGNGKFKYKWQDSSSVWHSSGMADSSYYRHPDSIKSIYIRLYVTSGACKSYTPMVKITVWQPISADSIAQSQWVEKGRMSKPLTSLGSLSGGSSIYTYLWQQSKNGLSWSSASIPNTLIGYTTPYFDSTRFYRRIVYSGQYNTCKDTSNNLKITIIDSISNNFISGTYTICAQTKPSIFTNSNPLGGTGIYKFRWETSSPNQTSWIFNSVDTFKSFKPIPLSGNTYFRRIVFSGPGDACRDTSNVVKITTVTAIINNKIFNNDTVVCNNQTPGILSGKTPSGGNDTNKFIWLKSINSVTWDSVGSLSSFTVPILFDTTYYMRKVVAGVCIDTSEVLKIVVLPKIQNAFVSENPHACYTVKSTIEGSVSGGDKSYKYNWQIRNNLSVWSDILTGNSKDLIISSPAKSDFYRRIVLSGLNDCCKDTSKILTLIIDSLPKSIFTNFEMNVCNNVSFPLSIALSGKPNFNINYSNGYKSDSVSGINTSNYTLQVTPDAQETFTYNITKLIDGNNCPAKIILGTGILHAYNKPSANAGKDTAFCEKVAKLHAIPSIGSGLWKSVSGTDFGGNQSNAITQAIAPDYGSQVFTWIENNSGCKDSASITIRFDKQLDKSEIDAGENQSNIFSFNTQLNASIPSVGAGRWSSLSNAINFEDSLKNNTEVSNLKLGSTIFIWTVSNGVCKSVSDSVIVLNNDIKIPNGISPNKDGKNELFAINGLDNVDNAELFIINKWGTEVYHNKSYKNSSAWDGGSLPPDTYYYILNVIGKTYKGYLVIRK